MLGNVLETTCPSERDQHISPVFSVRHQEPRTRSEKETMMSFDENLQKKNINNDCQNIENFMCETPKNLWDSCGREDRKKYNKETRAAAWFYQQKLLLVLTAARLGL